jgi:type IV secretion system protein VirD4
MRPPTEPPAASRAIGDPVAWVVGTTAAATALVYLGAVAAATVTGGSPGTVTFGRALRALVALPRHLSDPAEAWPEPAGTALPGPLPYWGAQMLVILTAAALGAAGWRAWCWATERRPGALGITSEAGFAARRDLDRLAVPAAKPGRVTVGWSSGRLLACEPQASLAVVGPTGCGKTAGFAIPALLEWRGPVLAVSVKADLLQATITHRQRQGRIWTYDPTGCSGHPGDGWSPLAACDTWTGALRMSAWMAEAAQPRVDSVSDGDYWYAQARKGLAPYLHAAATGDQGIADVVRWVDTQDTAEVEAALRAAADRALNTNGRWRELFDASADVARDLLRSRPEGPPLWVDEPVDRWPAWLGEQLDAVVEEEWRADFPSSQTSPLAPLVAARALWDKEPRLRGSVFATMENVLAGWADPGVGRAADHHCLDLTEWLSGDNTIYVVAAGHEQQRLRPVLTVLAQQAIRAAYDTANDNGGRLPHPALVLLDEAGNTAPLRDLPAYASTARSHGITLVTVWQDLAQIKATYRDRAQTVLNNHRAKLFGTGIADDASLDYVSRLVGDEHRTERNVSGDVTGARRSFSEHATYRRAAPVDVLRRIRADTGVLLYGSELPAHVRLRPWFTDRGLQELAGRPDLIRSDRPRRHRARLPGRT